jgi:periplasmic copper chaperone A
MKHIAKITALLVTATLSISLWAQTTEVQDAWARATVSGQKASGAFMTLTAKTRTALVGVSSPVAGVAEVHEMKMEGDIMQMRALETGLELPAGKPVELKPGSYHVMLMDLKQPLQKNTTIPLMLTFQDAKGTKTKQEVKVPVSITAPMGKPAMGEYKH